MRYLILSLCCLALTACANWGSSSVYRYDHVVAVNLTGGTVSDLRIDVLGTDKSISCDLVKDSAICDQRFGARRYPVAGLEVSWTHVDGSRRTETANPHIPAYFTFSWPLRVIIEINPDGSLESFHEQDDRDGGVFFVS